MPAWEQLCEKCLEPGIVGREHHEDEHDGVDQHTVICELAQCLGQDGQRGGGEVPKYLDATLWNRGFVDTNGKYYELWNAQAQYYTE